MAATKPFCFVGSGCCRGRPYFGRAVVGSLRSQDESMPSDSKLCVETGFRCTLSARETQAGTKNRQILNWVCAILRACAAGCGLEMGGYMLGKTRVRNRRAGIVVLG